MGALVPTQPSRLGAATAGAAVAASDTVALSVLGSRGAYLEVLNGNASPDSMTISDGGSTVSGSTPASGSYAVSVTNATNKTFFLNPAQADPITGLITITHSVTSTVTYKLYPLG